MKTVYTLGFLYLFVGSITLFSSAFAQQKVIAHIIPHSHCDPGWLDTFEGYYRTQVNGILTGITDALIANPNRVFNWAEISFFSRWYDDQNDEKKAQIGKLIAEGRFEFIGGGWVQNDEAGPYFPAVVRNVATGHAWLEKHFNVKPRIAWQIDPFGHSSLTPTVFAQLGYEAMVINRIHLDTKAAFKSSASMEFLWRGSGEGPAPEMLTHVLHTHYSAPKGYDFENGESPKITDRNVKQRAQGLARALHDRSSAYRTPHLLVPFGDDFKFRRAEYQFTNMEALFNEINNDPGYNVELRFSTVGQYFDAVRSTQDISFPVYHGDFYPYADNYDAYWTGYYSTRPHLKTIARATESILRASEILFSFLRLETVAMPSAPSYAWKSAFGALEKAREESSLVQHHDGITGTAKNHVNADYVNRLKGGVDGLADLMATAVGTLISDSEQTPAVVSVHPFPNSDPFGVDRRATRLLDESAFGKAGCPQGAVRPIILTNSLGWARYDVHRVTISCPNVAVTGADGQPITSQVVPIINEANPSSAPTQWELYFPVSVPPMGLNSYFIMTCEGSGLDTASCAARSSLSFWTGAGVTRPWGEGGSAVATTYSDLSSVATGTPNADSLSLANARMTVTIGADTGLPSKLTDAANGDSVKVNAHHQYFDSRGGAYISKPQGNLRPFGDQPKLVAVAKGPVVQVSQTIGTRFPVVVRLAVASGFNGLAREGDWDPMFEAVEVSSVFHADANTEVVLSIDTNLGDNAGGAPDNVFYTDNSLDLIKRERAASGPITHSTYPAKSCSALRTSTRQLTFMTDHTLGVASTQPWGLDLIVHRNMRQDDGRGLAEPINDNQHVLVPVWITWSSVEVAARARSRTALTINHPMIPFLGPALDGGVNAATSKWTNRFATKYSPVYRGLSLPDDVHLAGLRARHDSSDDLVLQVLRTGADKIPSTEAENQESVLVLSDIFADYSLDSMRLSDAAGIGPPGPRPVYWDPNALNGEDKLSHNIGSGAAAAAKDSGENQNTKEEGVFISDAALEQKRREEEEARKAGKGRLLLGASESAPVATGLVPNEFATWIVNMHVEVAHLTATPSDPNSKTAGISHGDHPDKPSWSGAEPKPVDRSKPPGAPDSAPVNPPPPTDYNKPPPLVGPPSATNGPVNQFMPGQRENPGDNSVGSFEVTVVWAITAASVVLVLGAIMKVQRRGPSGPRSNHNGNGTMRSGQSYLPR